MSLVLKPEPDDFRDFGLVGHTVRRTFTHDLYFGRYFVAHIDVVYDLYVAGPDELVARNIRVIEDQFTKFGGRTYHTGAIERPLDWIARDFPDVRREIENACQRDANGLSPWDVSELE